MKTSPMWIPLLLVGLMFFQGVGCLPVGKVLIKIGIYVGNVLVKTIIGRTIEDVLDRLFPSQSNVIVDKTDPKKGIFKGTMKITNAEGNEAILVDPQVARESETSNVWTLDPKEKKRAMEELIKSKSG